MPGDTYGFADTPDPSTAEGRALTVAVQALTNAIKPMPQAIIENTKAYAVAEPHGRPTEARESNRARMKAGDDESPQEAKKEKKEKEKKEGEEKGQRAKLGTFRAGFLRAILGKEKAKEVTLAAKKEDKVGPAGQGFWGKIGRAAGGVTTAFGALGGKVAALFTPLTMLGTYLNSSTSGFGLFNSAMRVFVATLAPILLPVLFVFAAALVSLSDTLWQHLLPAFADWTRFLVENGIPAIETFIKAVNDTAAALDHWWNWLKRQVGLGKDPNEKPDINNKDPFKGPVKNPAYAPFVNNGESPESMRKRAQDAYKNRLKADELQRSGAISAEQVNQIKQLEEGIYQNFKEPVDRARHMLVNPNAPDVQGALPTFKEGAPKERQEQRVPGEPGPAGKGGAGPPGVGPRSAGGPPDVRGVMNDLLKSLMMSNGPRASLSALTSVGSEKALAALNTDPLEARVQRMFQDVIQKLGQIVNNTGQQPEGQFKAGGGR